MLIKNGYFHVLEASNATEAMEMMKKEKVFFVIIEARTLTTEIQAALLSKKKFLVLTANDNAQLLKTTVELGVNHIMTYPFHSRKLLDKINSLI